MLNETDLEKRKEGLDFQAKMMLVGILIILCIIAMEFYVLAKPEIKQAQCDLNMTNDLIILENHDSKCRVFMASLGMNPEISKVEIPLIDGNFVKATAQIMYCPQQGGG